MKILIVFNHPAPYKVALFNGLAKEHDVHVIFERMSARNRNASFYNEPSFVFTLHQIKGLKIGNENHLSWGVKRHLKKNTYDLIIMNGYSTFTEMIALQYLKRKKIPYSFYINGGIIKKESRPIYKLKKHFIGGASTYFSPALKANEYLIHYGADPEKIFNYHYSTVYNNDKLVKEVKQKDKITYWQELGVIGNNFTICVTSFIKRKNNLTLIEAWKHIDKENVLILVGEGKLEATYRRRIIELGLSNVYILPFAPKKKVFEYLRHANNAIYLSNYDIYGHVINEALAHGLNVLTSHNMIAAHDLVKPDVNGLIADQDDDIVFLIKKLIKSKFFRNAVKSAKTIEQSVEIHRDILEKIV